MAYLHGGRGTASSTKSASVSAKVRKVADRKRRELLLRIPGQVRNSLPNPELEARLSRAIELEKVAAGLQDRALRTAYEALITKTLTAPRGGV
jgi:hypothetical protein